ncbi:type II toxin-antitoxin system VapC family toxin [Alienimonas chondri]|uniref:Ribonuclease VapC n=1 Tax=Alienimonas chondri TaxID=2681879 RepID=A0ABX1VAQ6_9PLAN|nr:PIN domain-containing protein [Alienimonas chondri]NNJ25180.1 Ribonuclease VapC26 [Alienimonas chondri]
MSKPVLIDTSVLVAAVRQSEAAHRVCLQALSAVPVPLPTTWPVLAETLYLLRRERLAVAGVINLVRRGIIRIEPLEPTFLDWYEGFAATYSDREVDLADGSLVHVAERLKTNAILTLDRRDFSVYRIPGGGAFRILPEPM